MRTTRKTTLFLASALALVTAGAALAGPDRGPRARGPWGAGGDDHPVAERFHEERLERLAVLLDLSEQQAAEWRAVHAARREAMEGHWQSMRSLHERIDEMAGAADPDAAAVGELVIEAHRARAAAQAERERVHEELMAVLTPAQRERFAAIRDLGPDHGRRGGHHGRHSGRRRGEAGSADD